MRWFRTGGLALLILPVVCPVAHAYERAVHYDLTKYLARWAGFSESEAEQVAAADLELDDTPAFPAMPELARLCPKLKKGASTAPKPAVVLAACKGNPEFQRRLSAQRAYHFVDSKRLQDLKDSAFREKGLKALGHYLHALQDVFAHSPMDDQDPPSIDQRLADLPFLPDEKIIGYLLSRHDADKTNERPHLAEQMARTVYRELTRFQGSSDRWTEAEKAVVGFVNAKDDQQKLAFLSAPPPSQSAQAQSTLPVRAGSAKASELRAYLPLPGSQHLYKRTTEQVGGKQPSDIEVVTTEEELNGQKVLNFKTTLKDGMRTLGEEANYWTLDFKWIARDRGSGIEQFPEPLVLLKEPLKQGTWWESGALQCILEGFEQVTTPAGTSEALRRRCSWKGGPATDYWLSPGVGVVRFISKSGDDTAVYDLARVSIPHPETLPIEKPVEISSVEVASEAGLPPLHQKLKLPIADKPTGVRFSLEPWPKQEQLPCSSPGLEVIGEVPSSMSLLDDKVARDLVQKGREYVTKACPQFKLKEPYGISVRLFAGTYGDPDASAVFADWRETDNGVQMTYYENLLLTRQERVKLATAEASARAEEELPCLEDFRSGKVRTPEALAASEKGLLKPCRTPEARMAEAPERGKATESSPEATLISYYGLSPGLVKVWPRARIKVLPKMKITNAANELRGQEVFPREIDSGGQRLIRFSSIDDTGIQDQGAVPSAPLTSPRDLEKGPPVKGSKAYMLRLPIKAGTTWKNPDGESESEILAIEDVTVPAGRFVGCAKVRTVNRSKHPKAVPEALLWYCPDVGQVKWIHKDKSGKWGPPSELLSVTRE